MGGGGCWPYFFYHTRTWATVWCSMQFEEGLAYFYWKMLECFLEFSFFPPCPLLWTQESFPAGLNFKVMLQNILFRCSSERDQFSRSCAIRRKRWFSLNFSTDLSCETINFCSRRAAVHHCSHSIVSYKAFCCIATEARAHMLGA